MKYLVLFAIVVQALAAPQGKPGNPGTGNGLRPAPSGQPFPPPSGEPHPFDHPNVTGPPPPNSFGTRKPPPGNAPPRARRAASDGVNPKPAKENAPPTGKPPVSGQKPPANGAPENKTGQPPSGNIRPKRHLKGHPTGAPHVEDHTHDFTGSHAHTGTAGKHGGGEGSRLWI